MSLAPGARLGPYEVVAPLGAGGMGEVYRARDSRLGRDVAIKVLPAALASDPDLLQRFGREARSASALNHPNIVTIYDTGSSESVSYIAMEMVNGTSLRALLQDGALPVRRLLHIGAQVADGLASAHAAGIVHRDLKPENVMVTGDGLVKILDFGLAKLTQPDSSGDGETLGPAASAPSEAGVIMGTVGYMSPQQASGRPVDYRSDQFSFGSMLYEMATGRRAFSRGSTPETLTAIIREEPEPIAALNPEVPAPVRWLIERCLAKEPRGRYTSTEDLARDLATIRDHLSEAVSAVEAPRAARPGARRRWRMPAAIAATTLIALAVAGWRLRQLDYFWASPLAGAHFTRLTDWEGSELDAAISPDGKFVAFASDRGGPFDVWVGQVGGGEFLNLTNGQFPDSVNFTVRDLGFSGDGTHVWWPVLSKERRARDLWLVPTMGGVSRPFLPDAIGAAWSQDGTRLVYHTNAPGDPIFVADGNGGNPRKVFTEQPGIHNHHPAWSPDGRFVYFVRGMPPDDMDVWRAPSAGGPPERLTYLRSRVAYPSLLDDRMLIYLAARQDGPGSGLYALDVQRRIPHPVSSGLEEYLSVAASGDGRRLVASVGNPSFNLWTVPLTDHVVDESGVRPFALPTVRAAAPRFGHDAVFYLSSKSGPTGLWKYKDGAAMELWKGSDGAVVDTPAISPDGARMCFGVRREGRGALYVMASDGTGARPIAEAVESRGAPTWSPDGKWLAVVTTAGQATSLVKIPVDGGPPERIVDGVNAALSDPAWSPDGKMILYSENKGSDLARLRGVTPDGQPVAVPDVEVRILGGHYRFMPDGRSLVILRGEYRRSNFWMLDFATGRLRQFTDLKPGFEMKSFDVSRDGKHILFDRYRENADIVLIDLPAR